MLTSEQWILMLVLTALETWFVSSESHASEKIKNFLIIVFFKIILLLFAPTRAILITIYQMLLWIFKAGWWCIQFLWSVLTGFWSVWSFLTGWAVGWLPGFLAVPVQIGLIFVLIFAVTMLCDSIGSRSSTSYRYHPQFEPLQTSGSAAGWTEDSLRRPGNLSVQSSIQRPVSSTTPAPSLTGPAIKTAAQNAGRHNTTGVSEGKGKSNAAGKPAKYIVYGRSGGGEACEYGTFDTFEEAESKASGYAHGDMRYNDLEPGDYSFKEGEEKFHYTSRWDGKITCEYWVEKEEK